MAKEKGYKKPPEKTRFKKGISGNPSGRPKKQKSFAEIFSKEIFSEMVIQENGRKMKVSKLEAIIKMVTNQSLAKGDIRSVKLLLNLYEKISAEQKTEEESAVPDIIMKVYDYEELDRKYLYIKEREHILHEKGEVLNVSSPSHSCDYKAAYEKREELQRKMKGKKIVSDDDDES